MLTLGLSGICLSAISPVIVLGQNDPASMPPQEGDFLVKAGDPASKPLGPADVVAHAPPLMAWPMDPSGKTVRKANRLNQVLLIRLTPPAPGDNQPNAVDDVLAFSALCTHAGCDVTNWIPETGTLSCDCHSSEFDAKASGRVVGGPAARPLPPLPLRLDGAMLVVAGPFATAVRFDE
jgi:rieske iron-sulfur protein